MLTIARVNNHVETNAAEGRVGTQAMDADVKDVDVLGREDPSELMEQSRLVVEPGAEREITTS
jgi:hypothetical protein